MGNVICDGVSLGDNDVIKFGTDNDFHMGFDGTRLRIGDGTNWANFLTDNGTTFSLSISADTDTTHALGRCRVGSPGADAAYFAHYDNLSTTNYAVLQSAAGATAINVASANTGSLRVNNTSVFTWTSATITCVQPFFVRQVTDAGPMTATNGTEGEIVYNLSNDKFYGCTATGTPATWAAFH